MFRRQKKILRRKRQKKTELTKIKKCFPKGVDGQKGKRKDGFLKKKSKGNEEKKKNRKKKRVFKRGLLGQENSLLGVFQKRHKTTKTQKKTFCMLTHKPQFLVSFGFFTYPLLFLQ